MKAKLEERDVERDKLADERRRLEDKGSIGKWNLISDSDLIRGMITTQKMEEEVRAMRLKFEEKQKKARELKEEKEQLEEELDVMKKKYKRFAHCLKIIRFIWYIPRQSSTIQEFEEAKEKFEKSLAELRTKLKDETSINADLQEKTEVLARDNETLKMKLDKVDKEKAKLKDEKDKRKLSERDIERETETLKV